MNEKLLQYIWQFQLFNRSDLQISSGEYLHIEKAGTINRHQGPDFSEAAIQIGLTRWYGNIEIHLLASDWLKHRHAGDKNYANIILHVVWEEDRIINDTYGNPIPTLILHSRVSGTMLLQYGKLMQQDKRIPCCSFLPLADRLTWNNWMERMAAERLERKASQVLELFRQANNWEETFWRMLSAGFGIRVNAGLFEQVAASLPIRLLYRHQHSVQQLEALLMGQANLLLKKMEDPYPLLLQRDFHFFQKKYQLTGISRQPAFLRMRPAAFPTIRLSQLAVLVHQSTRLFSQILEIKEDKLLQNLLLVTASGYWDNHYRFDEPAIQQPKNIGKQMVNAVFINTIIPVLYAYGSYKKENRFREKAFSWLCNIQPEDNHLIKQWEQWNIPLVSAMDTQALIELTNYYCTNKQCLSCAVGNKIMKSYV